MPMRIGVDIFRIKRMEDALKRNNPVYFENIFSPGEREEGFSHPHPHLYFAGRFALKEATFKSLGTKWIDGMEWNQIEITKTAYGAPQPQLFGEMAKAASSVSCFSASLSYEDEYVIAAVIAS